MRGENGSRRERPTRRGPTTGWPCFKAVPGGTRLSPGRRGRTSCGAASTFAADPGRIQSLIRCRARQAAAQEPDRPGGDLCRESVDRARALLRVGQSIDRQQRRGACDASQRDQQEELALRGQQNGRAPRGRADEPGAKLQAQPGRTVGLPERRLRPLTLAGRVAHPRVAGGTSPQPLATKPPAARLAD